MWLVQTGSEVHFAGLFQLKKTMQLPLKAQKYHKLYQADTLAVHISLPTANTLKLPKAQSKIHLLMQTLSMQHFY